ncbi:MAG: flagellar motor switch protein FliG [Gammaproteobacteria bacterium]|jgi:flagellar motor switch protein FliG|nr:flagellar motor switch protein FliG [Gammaproteobacteria bacterium]MBT4607918.1 flagellar motor switch protein FliG [Thiotrichales bacterium]MBT3471772.1 flagellar motor switch protein FliG [Gammaproteobacteria bacterium]MBT3966521.1 flagellar motor switch protein FliG [Gammaproteobacteria bacterium]MBT4080877.1 flagellar motor switch protein FliG [Gammaproteobacteria bacterium]
MADESDISRFSGIERTAVLLMAVGEDSAATILKNMDPPEVQELGLAMSQLKNVTTDELRGVLGAFIKDTQGITAMGMNSDDYIRNVLSKTMGADKADSLLNRMSLGANKGLEALKWMDAGAVSEMIRTEHPQVIAVVLNFLESEHAAAVIDGFPKRLQTDVMLRLASAEGIQSEALVELNNVFDKVANSSGHASNEVGGVSTAANILNFVQGGIDQDILAGIEEVDPDLRQEIEDKMFVFDDLVSVDDRGIQAMLRDIPTEKLAMALKGADDGVKDKFIGNMSKRAADMMVEDMEVMPPMKLSEVEAAQKDIIAVAKKLAEDGTIALGGAGGEEYV